MQKHPVIIRNYGYGSVAGSAAVLICKIVWLVFFERLVDMEKSFVRNSPAPALVKDVKNICDIIIADT